MADIFVSYCSEDRDRVEPLVRTLLAEGFRVWWDPHIEPGHHIHGHVNRQLAEAKCILVAWSRRSVTKPWVIAEATMGQDREVLVPISLDGVKPPVPFNTLNTGDFSNWIAGTDHSDFKRVLRRLRSFCVPVVPPRPRVYICSHVDAAAEREMLWDILKDGLPGAEVAPISFESVIAEYALDYNILDATVFVVVIGPTWLQQVAGVDGHYVRRQIELAVAHKLNIYVVLTAGTVMPSELPKDIAGLEDDLLGHMDRLDVVVSDIGWLIEEIALSKAQRAQTAT